MDGLLVFGSELGYAGTYHENGVSGWTGPTGFYSTDVRKPLAPDESKTWSPLYLWATPAYVGTSMNFALQPYDAGMPPTNRRYSIQLVYVPPGVTGAPPVGTSWQVPCYAPFLVPVPTYATTDGLTGYQFAMTFSAEQGPCAGYVRGDANCNGVVDFVDIDAFVAALSGQAAWKAFLGGNPACDYLCANDINQDGVVDFADIDPFVQCLSGNCP